MKILFYPQQCIALYPNILEERPLGGIETGVVRLAEALESLGHTTFIVTSRENPALSAPLYLPPRAIGDIGTVDLFVAVRSWEPLMLEIPARRRAFWTGDAQDLPSSFGIGDRRVAERIDAFFAASGWHADTVCASSGFPRDKAHVLPYGVHLPLFSGSEQRRRKRLIYSSTPFRGLKLFAEIMPELRKRHPDVELVVCGGMETYNGAPMPATFLAQMRELTQRVSALPGVITHGSVVQRELARHLMSSSILAYPNTFAETGCITALEAQAAGCVIVSSELAALRESVKDAGILLKERPGSPEYIRAFIDATDAVLSDDALWHKLSQTALEQARSYGWESVASRLLAWMAATPARTSVTS